MANLFNQVKPGDLITADFMNQVLAQIQALSDQVSSLIAGGPGGPPTITSISPGPLHVGDVITILGQNFAPLSSTVVSFSGTTVSQFESGSGDSILSVKIPTLFVSDQGTPVFLTISTPKGSTTTSVTIFPALPTIPDGTLLLSLIKSPSGNISANSNPIFTFRATATLNMDETFDVTPSVDVGWPAVFADSQGNAITPSQVLIQKGASSSTPVTVDIPIKVSIPNNPAPTGKLTLKVSSQKNSKLSQTSGPFTLTINSAPPVVSDKISPSLAFPPNSTNWDGTNVLVPAGGQLVAVPFSVFFVNQGSYNIKIAQPTNDPNKLWTVKLFTSPSLNVGQDNSTVKGIAVTVTAQANAPDSAFVFRVESQADNTIATELPVPIKLK